MKQIAIIAPTASGKTALSIEIAHKTNAIILSLDSLAIYKEIDIASAKPTLKERDGIVHFGIDEIYPDEKFDVMKFIEIYKRAKEYAIEHGKNLIIVGGTGFYLKAMIDGISPMPEISDEIMQEVFKKLDNLEETYNELYNLDEEYMQNIKSTDKYRIEKALLLYLATDTIPSVYFEQNPPIKVIEDIKLFEIEWDVDKLNERIAKRTKIMIEDGILDETIYLEQKYKRAIPPMGSIGIKEALEYLDGKLDKKQLEERITIATRQLAKRQRTFNRGQFQNVVKDNLQNLKNKILQALN
jgi:tRNA dimethylallyltransferase